MKKLVKVTIQDFSKLKENLNDIAELALYEQANGHTYEAEIEHDGYAVIDLTDDEYIELAQDEYELIIPEWKNVGQIQGATLRTKSDPDNDTALLYQLVGSEGQVVLESSLSKEIVKQLAQGWFGKPQAAKEKE